MKLRTFRNLFIRAFTNKPNLTGIINQLISNLTTLDEKELKPPERLIIFQKIIGLLFLLEEQVIEIRILDDMIEFPVIFAHEYTYTEIAYVFEGAYRKRLVGNNKLGIKMNQAVYCLLGALFRELGIRDDTWSLDRSLEGLEDLLEEALAAQIQELVRNPHVSNQR